MHIYPNRIETPLSGSVIFHRCQISEPSSCLLLHCLLEMALRRDQEQRIGIMHHDNSIEEDEDGIEFANYAESDDDDEDPYFMPEHTKKSHTLSFSR